MIFKWKKQKKNVYTALYGGTKVTWKIYFILRAHAVANTCARITNPQPRVFKSSTLTAELCRLVNMTALYYILRAQVIIHQSES